MNMSLNLKPLCEAGLTVTRVHVLIQKAAFSQEMDLEIDGEMATGVFEGLTPGIYEIFVNLYEGESLIATGTGEGVVVAGQTTTATIQMEVASGNLEVVVEWGPDPVSSVIAAWDFNEGDGSTLFDISGNDHDGQITEAEWTNGVDGAALEFDGENDYVFMPGGAWLTQPKGTLEAWVNVDPAETGGRIFSTETAGWANGLHINWSTQLSNDEIINGGIYGGIHSTEGGNHYVEAYIDNVNKGQWHFVALAWDSEEESLLLFVDGVSSTVISPHLGIVDTGEPLTIGCWQNQDNRGGWFNGSVDHVRLYDKTLSIEELNAHWCERAPDSSRTIVDFTPFSREIKWIEINDRDPVGLPFLRWAFDLDEIPGAPILSFDYAGAEAEFTQVWVGESLVTYLPETGGDEAFQHMEIEIDPNLLRTGYNQVGFISSFLPAQNEADGVLFKNVSLGTIDFTPFAPEVAWVECNDRDPVGLPFLRWRFTLSDIPVNPSLVFEYAGAETDSTQFWVGETLVAYLPATGGDVEFSSYEIEIDSGWLQTGDNQLGFITGYIPTQNEADGVLFRNVRLVGEVPE